MSPLSHHHCRFEFRFPEGDSFVGFVSKRPGEQTPTSMAELYDNIERLGWRNVLLDFDTVTLWHSGTLGRLHVLLQQVQVAQGRLFVCNLSDDLAEVLRITHLDQLLSCLPTLGLTGLEDAVNELFGPVRPVTIDPGWRTETVTLLTRRIQETGDYSAMPILADALQDAGCDAPEVLNHCREAREHVRGCWVVDLVLGKG